MFKVETLIEINKNVQHQNGNFSSMMDKILIAFCNKYFLQQASSRHVLPFVLQLCFALPKLACVLARCSLRNLSDPTPTWNVMGELFARETNLMNSQNLTQSALSR